MNYYPMHVCLAGCTVVVVGAGAVGQRKIAGLLAAGPKRIVIIDPALTEQNLQQTITDLCAVFPETQYILQPRSPEESDFLQATLAFATTNDPAVNQMVFDFCQTHRVLCNRADSALNNFIVPASTRIGDISVTISTDGASPALARQLRLDIEDLLGKRYAVLCKVLKRVRPQVLALGMPTSNNTEIFRQIVQSPLKEMLEKGQTEAARNILEAILPEALHAQIAKVLHDI